MKGCRISGTIINVLVLASLLLFAGCGIPNYLNLDREITISSTSVNEEKFVVNIKINTEGLSKLTEYNVVNGPSLKFFYVLSTNGSQNAPVTSQNSTNASYYQMSYVPSTFKTNYVGAAGNGISWSPEKPTSSANPSAPGFFLYTDADDKYRNFARDTIQIKNRNDSESGILVGTFSYNQLNLGSLPADYAFGTVPYMDIVLPSIPESQFTITKEQAGAGQPYAIVLDDGTPANKLYFASYERNLFPQGNSLSELAVLLDEDPYFYKPIVDEIADTSGSHLYLHIWAAIYAGEGGFTNIYWSPLQHVGTITLF